jgi:lysyl-tRNA synthetase class 2
MTQSELLKSIREYFWNLKFTEIETPYLNSSLPLEPNLYTFKTTWTHKNQDYYLPTSPEFALKEHLAKNRENCFAISHCFRDLEGESPNHSPEFLMLEWYEVGKNYRDLIHSTKNFINNFIDIDFEEFTLPKNLPDNEPDFNQYFLNEIENKLPKNKAVFVTGYPAFLSPLAKIKDDSNQISDRFELYINAIEIANACTENTDSNSILKSFEKEKEYRQKNNLPLHPYDTQFAHNSAKISLISGIGLGVNRFLEIINNDDLTRKKTR